MNIRRPVDDLPAELRRENKRRCHGVLQKILTTGRFPLNNRGLPAHIQQNSVFAPTAASGGIDVGDILFRVRPWKTETARIVPSSTITTGPESMVTTNLAAMPMRRLSTADKETLKLRLKCALNCSENGKDGEAKAHLWVLMHTLMPLQLLGVSETRIDVASFGRMDPSVTTNLDGCVMLTADEPIIAGQDVALDYPYGELNLRSLWTLLGGSSDEYNTICKSKTTRVVKNNSSLERFKRDRSARGAGLRVVKYEASGEKPKYRTGYPIGRCMHGTEEAYGLVQVRLFMKRC